ncbi:MAG TPA: cytochrome o ubiquinol oxidase subunit III [Candidatus Saccharimonadales bacterium]|nr:cytochrome o ubiquinol oxidase subunit III [Candidatus Saccharimonadales bacterium]
MSELTTEQTLLREEQREADDKTLFGFWAYIMTDCVLFASLFATYAVLHNNAFGGQTARQLFDLHNVLIETLCLLTSSFTCGLAMLAVRARKRRQVIGWFVVTFLLGVAFLALELTEFHHLAITGNSWRRSGFLSSFFTLVGTHGLHITVGLIWMMTMLAKVSLKGFTRATVRRLNMLSLFWHFLDIVWIFIFTIVYMLGAVS